MSEPAAFSRRAVAGLLGLGLVSFAGFALVLAFNGGPTATDGGTHGASRAAVGFAGVVQVLRDTGSQVSLSRAPGQASGQDGASPSLIVFTPAPGVRGPATMPPTGANTVLIVLPKWKVFPFDRAEQPGWVERDGLLYPSRVLRVLPADWAGPTLQRQPDQQHPALQAAAPLGQAPSTARVSQLQTLAGPDWVPVLQDAAGGIVLGRHATGPYVLADPDLLNNLAMDDLSGASEAASLLTALSQGQAVVFDQSLNGFGRSRNLLRLMFEPPMLGATLCALAAVALTGLLSIARFGPARLPGRAIGAGKQALADNAAGLIALAHREARMARPYAELTRTLAARITAAPRRLTQPELDAYLDRAGAIRSLPDRFSTLLAEAGAVRDRTSLMRLASRLHRWRLGLVHGHH